MQNFLLEGGGGGGGGGGHVSATVIHVLCHVDKWCSRGHKCGRQGTTESYQHSPLC